MTKLIRTQPCPSCFLCGTTGEILYADLTDRLFNAPGVWQIKRCPGEGCGLLWLDPMPEETDLPLIYDNYYTHQDKPTTVRGLARQVAHWAYHAFLRATGLARQREQLFSLYLRGVKPGRLLDVGCGDGGRLALWQSMGWQVEGQEVDAAAAERARDHHRLRVHLGVLPDLALPGSVFDVVTMNHVIEHVPDPLALVQECHRLLKPGGKLIAVTPNVNSLGHHRFGACWRGLEPPRHLHLFSPTTLNRLGDHAGFHSVRTSTTAANAQFLAEASLCTARTGRYRCEAHLEWRLAVQSLLFQFRAMIVHLARKDSGEECVLNAVK
jgi:2-polyprenyl-3-methyl-5-hydroxy-6-metoxy-1,4-benzoquinol methylase